MAFRSRGLPSRGCNNCRSRKIGCDEAKPVCGRCIKTGYTDCKYRDEFERTWRSETKQTAKRVQARSRSSRRPEAGADATAQGTISTSTSTSGSTNGSTGEATPPDSTDPGSGDLESRIFERLSYDWTMEWKPVPGLTFPWFKRLPGMLADAGPNSLLAYCTKALAYASYGKRFHDPSSLAEGVRLSGEALRLLNSTMRANVDTQSDQLMISIILLGFYEVLVDDSVSYKSSWAAHTRGAATLLRLKSQEPSNGPSEDSGISNTIFRQMLHSSLIAGRAPPIPVDQVVKFCPSGLHHVSRQTELVCEAAFLCSEWREALENRDSVSLVILHSIATTGLALDKKLEEWSRNVPPTCAYSVVPLTKGSTPDWLWPLIGGPWAPQGSHDYATPVAKMLWRFYWETRLILAQALLFTNLVLKEKGAPSNPISVMEKEIEFNLLSCVDRLCESCLNPLSSPSETRPQPQRVEDIRSLQGYLLIQILPTVAFSLGQAAIVGINLRGRKEWVQSMQRFVRVDLGFAKGSQDTETMPSLLELPVQLWGLRA